MLSVGVALFILAAGFSTYELIRARNVLSATEGTTVTAPPSLDKAGLERTLSQYESRTGLYSAMRENLPTTTDPSL